MSTEDAEKEWLEASQGTDHPEDYLGGISDFKSALREEIQKMQNECTDNGEYVVLEQLKEKLDSLTPKK